QQARLAQQQATARKALYQTATTSVTYELPVQEKVKVAQAFLGVKYDNKGHVKKYSADELKKKQDPDMPGYTGAFTDLLPNQRVKAYLAPPQKSAASPAAPTDQRPAPKGQGAETAPADVPPLEERPAVRMILILRAAPAPDAKADGVPKQP